MKETINILFIICLSLFFCSSKVEKENYSYTLAFVKEIYVDEGNYSFNEKNDSTYTKGDGKITENFIGVFSKKQDTVTIYKLNNDLNEEPEKYFFWSKKKNNQSIIFYCSAGDNIKITFNNQNNITVNNDVYRVNKEYFSFLKQKVLIEKSVLDLAFFLKDGYGDYDQSLRVLNLNWRNQKEDRRFKIIKAKIKNRNYQTDNEFFNYDLSYEYGKNGLLKKISGENSYNKKNIEENEKRTLYKINKSINERASDEEYLYIDKKTLFDSVFGRRIIYSNTTSYYYRRYQSTMKIIHVTKKPKKIEEIMKLLKIE